MSNISKGGISVVSKVTNLVIVSVQRTKTKMTKNEKTEKMTTERKMLTGYATIFEERSINVEIAKIKRMTMKRKTRKQSKPSTEMMMTYYYIC